MGGSRPVYTWYGFSGLSVVEFLYDKNTMLIDKYKRGKALVCRNTYVHVVHDIPERCIMVSVFAHRNILCCYG